MGRSLVVRWRTAALVFVAASCITALPASAATSRSEPVRLVRFSIPKTLQADVKYREPYRVIPPPDGVREMIEVQRTKNASVARPKWVGIGEVRVSHSGDGTISLKAFPINQWFVRAVVLSTTGAILRASNPTTVDAYGAVSLLYICQHPSRGSSCTGINPGFEGVFSYVIEDQNPATGANSGDTLVTDPMTSCTSVSIDADVVQNTSGSGNQFALITISQTTTNSDLYSQAVLSAGQQGEVTATPRVDQPVDVWVSSGSNSPSAVSVFLNGQAHCFTLNGVAP